MIDELIELAKSNQMLAAGIGTIGFGSVMYFLRAIPTWLIGGAKRLLSVELTLNSRSPLYEEILVELTKHRIPAFARNFTTGRGGEIVAGYGESLAMYRGRLAVFHRKLNDDKIRLDETLHVRMFTRNLDHLRTLVAEAIAPNDQDQVKVYTGSAYGGYWNGPVKKRKRALETVFTNGDQKELIVERIKWFLANEDWYLRCGIPYKLVFLLTGIPGTGKTSLVYGIASHFSRALCTVTTLSDVDTLLRLMPDNAFAVFEDIDLITVARPQDDKSDQPSIQPSPIAEAMGESSLSALQKLMQTLDGLATPHGLIVFITTNHRDRLEPALIRPGRVDHDLEIGPIGADAVRQMFAAYYGEDHIEMVEPYLRGHSFKARPGAEVQQILLEEATPAGAVRRLADTKVARLVAT